jgi:hypothetical protein
MFNIAFRRSTSAVEFGDGRGLQHLLYAEHCGRHHAILCIWSMLCAYACMICFVILF